MSRTLCPTGARGEVGCPRGAVCGAAEGSAVGGAQARSCHRSLDVVLWRLHRPPSFSSDSQAWSSWTGWGLRHLWLPRPHPGPETPGPMWHVDSNRENSVVVRGAVALGAQEQRLLVPAVRLMPGD